MIRKTTWSTIAAMTAVSLTLMAGACGGNSEKQATNAETAQQKAPAAAPVTDQDKSFMNDAAKAGYDEIQLSKLALEKSHNKDVREFAQKLIDDHEKAASKLAQVASTKSVTLPDSKTLGASLAEGKLKMYSGRHFDEAFLSKMVDDHKDAVTTFQKEASKGSDMDVKDFASTTIPTLQEHLEKAQGLENEIKTHKGAKG